MWRIYRCCPDYLPTGGLWKISLYNGVYRICYPLKNWRNLGSYTVEGDHLTLVNDPYCQYNIGVYTIEAGVTGHWMVPDGCEP
jgi:hypothetical protein